MDEHIAPFSPSSAPTDSSAHARFPLWALLIGLIIIAVQLLAFDRMVEQHARQAQARAASYVTLTLHQPGSAAAGASTHTALLAGN